MFSFHGLAIAGLTQMNSHECGSPLNTKSTLVWRRASAFSMVQVAFAATCVLTRLVSRGACRVAAVGRLAETAVDGPQCAGDMYQNPAARLWLIEHVGMYRPTVLRTGEPGTTEVAAFFS